MSEIFGRNLKKVMKEKNMTQEKLAEFVGVERSTISKYVTNKAEPSLDILCAIKKQLGTSYERLIEGFEKPQKRMAENIQNLSFDEMIWLETILEKVLKK